MQPTSTRLFVPMPLAEKALLTYQAMNQSDDIVILLESAGDAASADALIVGANDAFRRASGYSNDQLLGRSATDLFPPPNEIDGFRNAIHDHCAFKTELTCRRADGTSFVLGLHLMPAPAHSPGRKCSVILGRDITEALQLRQTQNAIQRLLAKAFFCVDGAISIVDGAGRFVMANPAFNRLLGYRPNEVDGRNSLEIVAPESRMLVASSIRQQMEQKGDMTYVAQVMRADGSQLSVRVTSMLAPIDNKQFRIVTLHPKTAAGPTGMRTESAGRINLIELDEVRAALGDKWDAVAARAMATAEVVLKRRCGPQDSYSRADETSFVVCFGSLSEKEASFRAAVIGREIRERLIGQGENPDTALVCSVAAAVPGPAKDCASDDTLHTTLMNGLDNQLGRLEEDARQTLRTAWTDLICELVPVSGRDPKETVANQVRLPGELEQRLMAAMSVLPRKEAEAFDLDALMLGLAARQAISAMGGVPLPLLVNVRFDIFLTPAATERFLVTCRKIDPRVSSRLILMLSAPPQGLPKSRLLDYVARLRSFCSGVEYHAGDMAAAEALELSNSFNPIVALPFGALSSREADKLKRTIAVLHARRARVLIHGVATQPDAAACRLLGADMIAMA